MKKKVLAYIFRENNNQKEILVFDHKENLEVSPQVICGSVDGNETEEDAILREIFEESGLSLKNPFKLGGFDYFRKDIEEKQIRNVYCFNIDDSKDNWTHAVSSGEEDKGLEFNFYWLPVLVAKSKLVADMGSYLKNSTDITIIGGGFASTMLAIQSKRKNPNLKITILELSKDGEMEQKIGESTSDITAIFLRRFGIDHILEKHINKTGLRFIFKTKDNSFSEYSSPSFKSVANGFQINRKLFDEDLLRYAQELGIEVIRPARFINFSEHATLDSIIYYEDVASKDQFCLKTKWLIDATGRKGLVAKKLGWRESVSELNTAASWGYYKIDNSNLWDPIQNVEWDQLSIGGKEKSTTHFLGEGYWAWHFPISKRTLSFGIVYDKSYFKGKSSKSIYNNIISDNELIKKALSEKEVSEFKHFNSLAYKSKSIVKPGFASIGDASAFVDPLFSPGMEIIVEQSLSLSSLLTEDFSYNDKMRWQRYEKDLLKSIDTRIFLYKDRYKIMGEFDLFTNWTQLDFFGYYIFHVLPSVYFPAMIKYTPKFNFITKALYKFFKNRILKIYEYRKANNQLYKSNQSLKFSKLLVPNLSFAPFKVIELLLLWLTSYIRIEMKQIKSKLLK